MEEIIVTTQSEYDALPPRFEAWTVIIVKNDPRQGLISVEARENSSVVAYENSSVEAWGNSSVEAWGNSFVVARENSSVVAYENSSVKAWGNSSVEAWGNSFVVARENSSVVACENSSVEAWGNSSVEAWGNVGVHLHSDFASVALFMFAVCWVLRKGKVAKKSETATIIEPKSDPSERGWLSEHGIEASEKVILFKRVSADFKTQEGKLNETSWKPGSFLSHSSWSPARGECGEGKFHACPRPYFADEFRSVRGDRYVAVEVVVIDIFAWPGDRQYAHKIAFRAGLVLYECDRMGKRKP